MTQGSAAQEGGRGRLYVRFYSDWPAEEGPLLGPFEGLRVRSDTLVSNRGLVIAEFVVNSWLLLPGAGLRNAGDHYDNFSIIYAE